MRRKSKKKEADEVVENKMADRSPEPQLRGGGSTIPIPLSPKITLRTNGSHPKPPSPIYATPDEDGSSSRPQTSPRLNGPSVRPKTHSKNNGIGVKKGAISVPSPVVPHYGFYRAPEGNPKDPKVSEVIARHSGGYDTRQYLEPVYSLPIKANGKRSPNMMDEITTDQSPGSHSSRGQGSGSTTSSSTSLASVIHVANATTPSRYMESGIRPKTLGTIADTREEKEGPDSPGSQSVASEASSIYAPPSEPSTPKLDRAAFSGKQTLGDIIAQIESKSKTLLQMPSYTTADATSDLQFIALQSRYSSDIGIKRRLISKLVENGLLDIFLKVFPSVHKVDFYKLLEVTEGSVGEVSNGLPLDKSPDNADEDKSVIDDETSSVKDLNLLADSKHPRSTDAMRNLRAVVTCLWNSTDKSPQLCDQCSRRGVIQLLLKELEDPRLAVSELKEHNRIYLVKGYLGILNNIIRYHDKSREIYRESSAVKLLQAFQKAPVLMIKTKAVMLLSYVINETENDIINATDKNIAFMVKMLQSAIENDNHYSKKFGYWAVEIIAGLNRLASCEYNKERILHKGALPLYSLLIEPICTEEEQLVSALGIWTLAFNEASRQSIRDDSKCIRGLEALYRSSQREEIRRAARGALWLVEGRLPPMRPAHLQRSNPDGPVVISFQWSSRSVVGKIKDRLRSAGYMVTTYTENSGGPSVELMIQHLEMASVVLVAMSHKYKDDPHCRTEVEIATRLGLDLVPIRAQPRYSPEGWLGHLLSDKMCFDFTQDANLDLMTANLIRELANRGHLNPTELHLADSGSRALSTGSIHQVVAQIHSSGMQSAGPSGLDLVGDTRAVSPYRPFRALGWSADDVAGWLRQNSLAHVADRFRMIDGELLSELRKMQRSAPESFYATLRQDLKFDLVTTLKFTKALDYL